MELIEIEQTRLTALFGGSRLEGQLYLPGVVATAVDRYKFSDYPTDIAAALRGGALEFRHGLFKKAAFDLAVYNDGIIISSQSNSEVVDEAYQDIISVITKTLGFSIAKAKIVDRLYDSTIVVKSDKPILEPINSIAILGDSVSTRLRDTNGMDVPFEPVGFSLSADYERISGMKPSVFRVERKAGRDFSLNHYYSTAPLRTDDHLAVLGELEALA